MSKATVLKIEDKPQQTFKGSIIYPRKSLTRTALRILFLFLVTIEFIMGFFVAIAEHISDATTAIQQSLNETNPTTESKDEPPGSTP